MLSLHVHFTAGRYHGTAWGHHVNEGAIDWPPAPWRLLRALRAVAHSRCPDLDGQAVDGLLTKMQAPPDLHVPGYGLGHSRHYLPRPSAKDKTTLVLDSFVVVEPSDPVVYQWQDVDLSDSERHTLAALLSSLTYLGRAESWCEARLGQPVEHTISPGLDLASGDHRVAVRLLVPTPDAPVSSLDQSTAVLRKKRASGPSDTRAVSYAIPGPQRAGGESVPVSGARPTFALLGLSDVERVENAVLPPITDTIDIAHLTRSALVKLATSGDHTRATPDLLGRRGEGARRDQNRQHQHAHFLPLDLEQQRPGQIDHVAIWVPEGMSRDTTVAIASLQRLYMASRDRPDLLARLVGLGALDEWGALGFLGGPSKTWRSRTPFLLTRHPKKRGGKVKDAPEDQVRRELRFRGLPEPVGVRRVPLGRQLSGGRKQPWTSYRRRRGRRSRPPTQQALGFELQFDQPVTGPIALGWGSHFGMGLFEAVEEEDAEE